MLRLVGHGLASLALPGHALSLAGRRTLAALAMGLAIGALLLIGVSPYFMVVFAAVCVVAAVAGAWTLRRAPAFDETLAAITGSVYVVVFVGVVWFAYRQARTPSVGMAPTLLRGDLVRASRIRPVVAGIDRGDVIILAWPCNPSREYVKRVIGVPGDRVAITCGHLWLNGQRVPREHVADGEELIADDDPQGSRRNTYSRFSERLPGRTYDIYIHHEASSDHDFPAPGALVTCDGQIEDPTGDAMELAIEASNLPAAACTPRSFAVVPPGGYFVLGDNRDDSSDSRVWGAVPAANVRATAIGVVWPPSRWTSLP